MFGRMHSTIRGRLNRLITNEFVQVQNEQMSALQTKLARGSPRILRGVNPLLHKHTQTHTHTHKKKKQDAAINYPGGKPGIPNGSRKGPVAFTVTLLLRPCDSSRVTRVSAR